MVEFLRYRILFVTTLFTAFGGVVTNFAAIEAFKGRYFWICCMVSLVLNLLISLFLKGKWTVKRRRTIKNYSVSLFLLFLICLIIYFYLFDTRTFTYTSFESKIPLVKGEQMTTLGDSLMHTPPGYESVEELLKNTSGPQFNDQLWETTSFKRNTILLTSLPCVIIILLSSLVSLLAEVLNEQQQSKLQRQLNQKNRKSNKKVSNEKILTTEEKTDVSISYHIHDSPGVIIDHQGNVTVNRDQKNVPLSNSTDLDKEQD